MEYSQKYYDVIIVGAGVSGSFIADKLTEQNVSCLMLEAGQSFTNNTYPIHEVHTSTKLYWGGGIEFNKEANLAFLRPKVVGGGSVINGALVDRFDKIAFDDWKERTKMDLFDVDTMVPWYEKAESMFNIEYIPENARNGNAEIFEKGMNKKGYKIAPLRRAQKNCKYEEGNDCVECLSGCRIGSKQMMSVCTLERALKNGLELIPNFEVESINLENDQVRIYGIYKKREFRAYKAKKLVLAAGSIGNSKLLLNSKYKKKIPALGKNFYTHPQYMNLGVFDQKIAPYKKALQSYKSDEPKFREWGFKLENVFAPPAGISLLMPGYGKKHHKDMKKLPHMACMEVAIRDTNPGSISLDKKGNLVIDKTLNEEDKKRRDKGLSLINEMFYSAGAKEVIEGRVPIGLHLMGGCGIGTDEKESAVNPEFNFHFNKNVYTADSSIFPSAPGINPSLTIMALSVKACESILKGLA